VLNYDRVHTSLASRRIHTITSVPEEPREPRAPSCTAMGGDLDEWIALVRKCELIPERDLKHLCEYVQEIMLEESTVQPVQSPVTICGDIHGQVHACAALPAEGSSKAPACC
jgi:hypothetical protein